MNGKLSYTDKEAIVAELQSGKATETELAMRYSVSVSAISYNFKKITGNIFKPINRLSQTDKEIIVRELQSGKVTIKDLATRYGVHRSSIANNFKQITGQYLHPRRLSQRDRKIIVGALQSGKTPKELAPEYGVGSSYIGYIYKAVTGTIWRKLPNLSQNDKETIIAELQAKKASMRQLAKRYGVNRSRISSVFEEITGRSFSLYKTSEKNRHIVNEQKNTFPVVSAVQESLYRAWHTEQKRMYVVLGLNWLKQKVLINADGFNTWYAIYNFVIMQSSGLRDRKRTPEYPEGQNICEGDIIQFPINLDGKETEVKDVVAFDRQNGMFIVVDLDDPLALHNDECQVIGTIQENPELLGSELQRIRALLKESIFA